jgi:hypothetical protein
MRKMISTALLAVLLIFGNAQKLTLDNVLKAYIKGAGPIYEGRQVKGYYIFYESDKIDRKTREYTIQILDENSNPVKKATFQDHKDVVLYDAEFNGSSLCFFLINSKEKKYQYKIYDSECKLKYEYEKEYDRGDFELFLAQVNAMGSGDDATSNTLIAIPNLGFASLMPVRQGGSNFFEIGYYSSVSNKYYTYKPEFEERQVGGICMAVVDSTIYLEVGKKMRALSGKYNTSTYAYNVVSQKKVFEIAERFDPKYKSVPTFITKDQETGNLLMASTYFEEDDNVVKDYGLGVAIYTITRDGKILTKEYNPWQGAFSKYLTVNDKGKIDEIGYLCIQDIKRAADGKLFVAAEGYKRKFDALGSAFALMGSRGGGFTKIVITDLVLIEFDKTNKLTNATVYKKRPFAAVAGAMADQVSQHALAIMLKYSGSFDYSFTTSNKDNSSFSFCYTDWEKTPDYKGGTFNSIKYSNGKISTDKIQLSSKSSFMRIYPAKQGYVAIYEYFRKAKKVEFRLEKMN